MDSTGDEPAMPSFKVIDWFRVKGRRVAVVGCERDRDDLDDLLGAKVLVDGKVYRCVGVDPPTRSPTWAKGSPFGLMVGEDR